MNLRLLIFLFIFTGSGLSQYPLVQAVPAQPAQVQASPCDNAGGKTPDLFLVRVETTAGTFVIETHKAWAPLGVERFYQLVCAGFFDDSRFFRVVPKFVAQFGVAGSPRVNDFWRTMHIQDDPVKQPNKRGFVTYAMATGHNTRTTQLFINLVDNERLDSQGFAPIGRVVDGMDIVDKLYDGYGENAAGGIRGGKQDNLFDGGNAYMDKSFPKLDKLIRATITVPEDAVVKKNKKK